MSLKSGRPPRRYARTKAEAVRLGVPTYYEAKRSKAAAERTGISQRVLRGHPSRAKGEPSLREVNRALRALLTTPSDKVGSRPVMILEAGRGPVWVLPDNAGQAREAGRYRGEVNDLLEGRADPDTPLRARTIGGVEVETDPDAIEAWSRSGRIDDYLHLLSVSSKGSRR